jgi:hypothetical protein
MMTRRNQPADPTAEGTTDQSTQTASGLSGGKPERSQEDTRPLEDPIARARAERHTTPRQYEIEADDDVRPADDSSLNTKI